MDQGAVAAICVSEEFDDIDIYLDATNVGDANKVKAAFAAAVQEEISDVQQEKLEELPFDIEMETPEIESHYIYGQEDSTIFDSYGSAMIGMVIFFFVFIIAGINFLTERTSGTLEKMLSTPIRKSEIVLGYTLGYSVLAVLQTVIITLFMVYVIDMHVEGSIGWVLLINILTAICALTLGTLMSSLANSEFQMIQFIPIVVIPQVFLCGMFTLTPVWDLVGHFTPLYYSANALQKVMIQGGGWTEIYVDLLVLAGISVLFMLLNVLNLRKFRTW